MYSFVMFYLLSQRGPEYPGRHVQLKYPVDPLTAHDPLFRQGDDEQVSSEITKLQLVTCAWINNGELKKILKIDS